MADSAAQDLATPSDAQPGAEALVSAAASLCKSKGNDETAKSDNDDVFKSNSKRNRENDVASRAKTQEGDAFAGPASSQLEPYTVAQTASANEEPTMATASATSALISSAKLVQEQDAQRSPSVEETLRRASETSQIEVDSPAAAGLAAAAESVVPSAASTRETLKEAAAEIEKESGAKLRQAASDVQNDISTAAEQLLEAKKQSEKIANAAARLVETIECQVTAPTATGGEPPAATGDEPQSSPRVDDASYCRRDKYSPEDDSSNEEIAAQRQQKRKRLIIRALRRGHMPKRSLHCRVRELPIAITNHLVPRLDNGINDFHECGPAELAIMKSAFYGDVEKLNQAAINIGFLEGLGVRAALVADARGRTPLHIAALRGHGNVIRAFGRAWRYAATQARLQAIEALRCRLVGYTQDLAGVRRHANHTNGSADASHATYAYGSSLVKSKVSSQRSPTRAPNNPRRPKMTADLQPHPSKAAVDSLENIAINPEAQKHKRQPGAVSEALLREDYDWCAAEAKREYRACELRVEAAWRAALTSRDDLGRTPIHYAAACSPRCSTDVFRALFNHEIAGNFSCKSISLSISDTRVASSAGLETKSSSKTKSRLPLVAVNDIVRLLLLEPSRAHEICSNLFVQIDARSSAGNESATPKRWHPPGSLSKHTTHNLGRAKQSQQYESCETQQLATVFRPHEAFDASNGKHYHSAKVSPCKPTTAAVGRNSRMHGMALVKWFWRVLLRASRQRALRDRTSSNLEETQKHMESARFLSNVFNFHDQKCDGTLDMTRFGAALRSLGICLAFDTLEEIAAFYECAPHNTRTKTRLLVNYERLIDDMSKVDGDQQTLEDIERQYEVKPEQRILSEVCCDYSHRRVGESGRSDCNRRVNFAREAKSDGDLSDSERNERKEAEDFGQELIYSRSKRAGNLHRNEQDHVQANAWPYSSARSLAEVTLAAVGPMLAITVGTYNQNQPSLSAHMWIKHLNSRSSYRMCGRKGVQDTGSTGSKGSALWRSDVSYAIRLKDVFKARSALLNAHDSMGYTSLHVAAYNDVPAEAIKLIMQWGGNCTLRADDGSIADDLARSEAVRRSLRKSALRNFDSHFVAGEDVQRDMHFAQENDEKLSGFLSVDRTPGFFYEDAAKTLADSRFRIKDDADVDLRSQKATAALEMITTAAFDACDGEFNRCGGYCGAPSVTASRQDLQWRRVPSARKENAHFDLKRTALCDCTYFDACSFPLDRALGDGRLRTPLHLAAEAGLVDVAKQLISGWRVPSSREAEEFTNKETGSRERRLGEEKEGEAAALRAIQLGYSLDPCFNLDAHDVDGWTALHHACARGGVARRKIARLLLESGSQFDARTLRGRTSLHLAAASAQADLRRGDGPSVATSGQRRTEDAEMVALLCRFCGSEFIDAVDDAGETALMIAAARGRVGCASALLARGADAWHRHHISKATALHSACASRSPGAADAARLLSQWYCGGDGSLVAYIAPSSTGEWNDFVPALYCGANVAEEKLGAAACLLPYSIDASSQKYKNGQRQSALLAAAHQLEDQDSRYQKVVFCTQRSKSRPQIRHIAATPLAAARDAKGNSPRDAARSTPQREALDHLWAAAMSGSVTRIKRAIRKEQAITTAKPPEVRHPWFWVSAHDRTPIKGRTALHLVALGACRAVAAASRSTVLPLKVKESFGGCDFAGCAQCLVSLSQADIDAEDSLGRVPLHYAAAGGSITVASTLISAGANVGIEDDVAALTPLHLARAWSRVDVSRVLIVSGASDSATDRRRRTPKDVAGLGPKLEVGSRS